ncbi:hypothetical protein GCM10022263_25980 [Nocardioides daeguensis]|uniref:Uncharacterized protein n=1 Tax=Nocardioides daeguensis TaxID=908359 RepID=A0ABP6VNP4_9ACTN
MGVGMAKVRDGLHAVSAPTCVFVVYGMCRTSHPEKATVVVTCAASAAGETGDSAEERPSARSAPHRLR